MKMKNILICFVLISSMLFSQRLKDVAYFKGVTSEQLIGYGLVVGLAGGGDSYRSTFTVQSITSMLKRFGITVSDINLRTRNVAAVMVTATVNNFLKSGSEFDVSVASMGDATSLMGGTLLMTPLSGKEGTVYGMSQGAVSVGGYDINTATGGRVMKNHALSGRIPNGGVMQQELKNNGMSEGNVITILLRKPDFTTASNISQAINTKFSSDSLSLAIDASEIKVNIPADRLAKLTTFLSEIEGVTVATDVIAKVVLNERTGTIVAGANVRILPVTISHGNLKISVDANTQVSQPDGFSQGKTVMFTDLKPKVDREDTTTAISINGATNVQEVATALNSLRVSPRDIIAIFQALKEAGALIAELIIM